MQTSYPVGPPKTVTRHFLSFFCRSLGVFESVTVVGYSGWLSVQLCRRVIPSLETQSWPRELFVHQEDLVRQVQTRKKKKKNGNKTNKQTNKKQKQKRRRRRKRRENNNTVSETPAKLSQDFTRRLKQQTTSFLPGP